MGTLTPDQFDDCFDRFRSDVFRLETLPQYLVDEEQERIGVFLRGEPRPERSARTNPWLARIARTVTVQGKAWLRLHAVTLPLSDYLRYQMVGYVESQACGEQIRILDNDASLFDLSATNDFWLFDTDTDDPYAVEMYYDTEGRWEGAELIDDPRRIETFRLIRNRLWEHGDPLNRFLATHDRVHARSS